MPRLSGLNAVPDVVGDACHAEWRETVVEDVEKNLS